MGTSQSKSLLPSPATPGKMKLNEADEQVAEYAAKLENLVLDDTSWRHGRSLDSSIYSKWEDSLFAEPKNRLALGAFTQGDMLNIIRNRDALISDGIHLFSHKIEAEGKPVTNQRSSGRCWLFASTNVMRVAFMKKYRHLKLR
jgi:bleomycin hydrolase